MIFLVLVEYDDAEKTCFYITSYLIYFLSLWYFEDILEGI